MNCSMLNRTVNIARSLIPVLAAALVLSACSTAERLPDGEAIKMSRPVIFRTDFERAVYKTNMIIYGNEISGLMVMKKTGDNYRVVFVSEIGLKYFDMEFLTGSNEVVTHHVNSLLDRKPVRERLQTSLSLVFMMHHRKAREQYFRDTGIHSYILEVKRRRRKSYYSYDPNFGNVHSIRSQKGSSIIAVSLSDYDHVSPGRMNFNQNYLSMHLEKIKTSE